jgi:hypothetical protein
MSKQTRDSVVYERDSDDGLTPHVLAVGQSVVDTKIRYGEFYYNTAVGAAETFCMQIRNKSVLDVILLWDENFFGSSVGFQYRSHATDLATLYGTAFSGSTLAQDTEIELRRELLAALPGTFITHRFNNANVLLPRTWGAFGGGLTIPAGGGLVLCTPVGTIAASNFQWKFQLKKG